jgi:hypothetical protein
MLPIWLERPECGLADTMNHASFNNLPALTSFPARSVFPANSVDGGRVVPASRGKGRLAAVLAVAAATEFLLVDVAAFFAAVLYQLPPLHLLTDLLVGKSRSASRSALEWGIRRDPPHAWFELICGASAVQL